MVFYLTLFHGLKCGFEYLPYLGRNGTLVLEFLFLRAVFIFGVDKIPMEDKPDGPSDVQDSD